MSTIQDLRISVLQQEQTARENEVWEDFCAENPDLAFDANFNILREFHHGEEITTNSIEESLPFLKDRLARQNRPEVEQAIVEDEAARKERLQGMSKEELKKIAFAEAGTVPLPKRYTPSIIKELPAVQLRALLQKYGQRMVNLRLQTKEEVD